MNVVRRRCNSRDAPLEQRLAIFFWMLSGLAKQVLVSAGPTVELAIFFWMLFKPRSSWLSVSCIQFLLFSFECCFASSTPCPYSTALTRLAIFFWMLSTGLSGVNMNSFGRECLAIFFWMLFARRAAILLWDETRFEEILLFSFECCWEARGGREGASEVCGACYFLLNVVVGKRFIEWPKEIITCYFLLNVVLGWTSTLVEV